MSTSAELAALACSNCPAGIHISRQQGIAGRVLVVAVEHEPTCPWLARYARHGATVAAPGGLLRHGARTAE